MINTTLGLKNVKIVESLGMNRAFWVEEASSAPLLNRV